MIRKSILVLAFMAVISAAAIATDFYWDVASGNWSVGANWDPAGPPDGTGKAFIDNGGTLNIDVDLTTLSDAQQIRLDYGVINQSANSVTTGYLMIADGGNATYNFSGGSIDATSGMRVGNGDGNYGFFNMTGGTLDIGASADLVVGYAGYGEFNVSAGTVTIDDALFLGDAAGSTGVVNQTGGTIDIAGALNISQYDSNPFGPKSGTGIYHLVDGSLTVGDDVYVGSADGTLAGVMHLRGGVMEVTKDFKVTAAGSYVYDTGAHHNSHTMLVVYGEFTNASTDNAKFDMSHTTLLMAGGGTGFDAGTQTWDKTVIDMGAVVDKGADLTGLVQNYAVGDLVFAGTDTGSIWYVLESDIYCYGLRIESGAVVDLNGYNIYYLPVNAKSYNGSKPTTGGLDGAYGDMSGGGGDIYQMTPTGYVPEPGTIVLIGTGVLGLAAVLRKKYC